MNAPEEALPPGVIKQCVIALDTGGGPMPLSVGDSFETVIERLTQATSGPNKGGCKFSAPFGGGRVAVPDVRRVVAVYEQLVQLTHDPRQAGIFKTGSGIELPRN